MLCSVNTNITGGILRSYRLQWLTLMVNISVRRCQTVPTPAPHSSTRNPGGTGRPMSLSLINLMTRTGSLTQAVNIQWPLRHFTFCDVKRSVLTLLWIFSVSLQPCLCSFPLLCCDGDSYIQVRDNTKKLSVLLSDLLSAGSVQRMCGISI